MAAPKGHSRWGGRDKGTPNKMTASAREAIELAFQGMGGIEALTTWAEENPTEFYTRVWPKILPLQIAGDPENPLAFSFQQTSADRAAANQEWLRVAIASSRAGRQAQRPEAEPGDSRASADSSEPS